LGCGRPPALRALAALLLATLAAACGSTSERWSLGDYDARLEVPPAALFDAALDAAKALGLDPLAFPQGAGAARGGRIEGRSARGERVVIEIEPDAPRPGEPASQGPLSRVSVRVLPWGDEDLVEALRAHVARALQLDARRADEDED
jgi:hypothetical protein